MADFLILIDQKKEADRLGPDRVMDRASNGIREQRDEHAGVREMFGIGIPEMREAFSNFIRASNLAAPRCCHACCGGESRDLTAH